MKAYYLILNLLYTINLMYSQNHDSYWYFGYGSLIEYDGYEIICHESYLSYSNKSSVVYSDSSGSLLFYGNGKFLYRQDNSYINNSNLDIGNYISDTNYISQYIQGSIVIPKPNSSNSMFIINNISNHGFGGFKGISYSVYNSDLLDGAGDIDTLNRNIHLLDDYIGEALSAVQHGNGKDWWLIMHQCKMLNENTNNFITFLFSEDSIYGPYYQSVGLLNNNGENSSNMIFNEDGNKFVYYGNNDTLELFSFNRCSGEINVWVNFSENFDFYGKAFSPDGSKLYISKYQSGKIYQYDLTAGETGDEIKASRQLVYNCPDDEHYIGSMALGPDDKIYFTTYYPYGPETPATEFNTYINVIHNPNASGDSCHVEDRAIWLCEGIAQIGLPNMPNYRLGALQGSECDTLSTAIMQQTKPDIAYNIYPNPVSNYLQVEASQAGDNTIIIRDIKGSVYYTGNFNNQIQIPVAPYAKGVYSITIINDETEVVWSDKFVKM